MHVYVSVCNECGYSVFACIKPDPCGASTALRPSLGRFLRAQALLAQGLLTCPEEQGFRGGTERPLIPVVPHNGQIANLCEKQR